jgi:molecular chaperone DnaJ
VAHRIDLYELLGVSPEATVTEIRRAYRRSSRRYHPALNPGDPEASERFEAIARAFAVLSDPDRRALYDRGGEEVRAAPAAPDIGFAGFDFSTGTQRRKGAGFREIFGDLLRPESRGAPTRGEDLERRTTLSFGESLAGAQRTLQLVRQDTCPGCGGRGELAFGPVPCPTCRGEGRVRASRGHMIFTRNCSTCGATGSVGARPCGRCTGEGRVTQSEQLEVEIPPGVAHGSRIEMPGAGNAGRRGGPPGDLVLVVEVEPHGFFRRDGDDLLCRIPISMTEAALGAHVEVPTPDGPVTIEVPSGTQSGQRFRLRKRGVPRLTGRGRGDLYVEAEVVVPRIADDRARALLEEFARINPHDPRSGLASKADTGNGTAVRGGRS